MAIADAEPKKGDVDVTSTGSSSRSKDMKKPLGPIKYSSLKDFSFSVSDIWDDRNICIFIECCHANIDDLKNYNGSEENKVWEKITKAGLERSGSVNCFNVNYCLELAKCLKSFVSKNVEKMMENEIFKLLYENVVDLLPYFAPVSPSRPRSRSKSVENTKIDKIEASNHLIIKPFDTYADTHKAIRMIANILKRYNKEDLKKNASRNAIWKDVVIQMDKDIGLCVSPKSFIESFKTSVASFVRLFPDPIDRDRVFRDQVDDLLPYFDLIPPRTIKACDFLLPDVTPPNEPVSTTRLDMKKRKPEVEETVGSSEESSTPKSKRRPNVSREASVESTMEVTKSPPVLRTYLKKRTNTDNDDSPNTSKMFKLGEEAEDNCNDPLAFLEDWNTSSKEEESPAQPDTVQSEKEVAQSTPAEKVPKKRGRKPKSANTPASTAKAVIPRKLPSRQSARTRSSEITYSNATSSEVSTTTMSKELVPVRKLTNTYRKKEMLAPKERGFSRVYPSRADTQKREQNGVSIRGRSYEESEDSEIEDVPLMGTNILVHRGRVEQTKPHLSKGNMNPVVLLDKMAAESYLNASIALHAKQPLKNASPKKQNVSPSTSRDMASRSRAEAPKSVETTVERRGPGRPRANQAAKPAKHSTTKHRFISARSPESPSVEVSSSSTAIARTNMNPHQVDRAYFMRELATQKKNAHSLNMMAMPPPASPSVSTTFPQNANQSSAPEWFDRFVRETRRHEMWKIHNLVKMQHELMDCEGKKKVIMEKILAVLANNRRS